MKVGLTVFVVGLAGSVLFQTLTADWSKSDRGLLVITIFGGFLAALVGMIIYYIMRERE
ncbi:hypothetical protein [Micromonospora okii]|uniref:hypothetical protein n=1 Tax=Micromonospora okii TaxID=1182970 RepID=UPI001E28C328|nr:hypothetical protein [Micromonospora okii]